MRDIKSQIASRNTPQESQRQSYIKILQEAQWRITAEEDMLDKCKHEREIRNSSPYDEEL